MADYSYDWTDFVALGEAELDAGQLQTRVDDDGSITTACTGVTVDAGEETVVFTFDGTPDAGELTALDALVAAYDGETLDETKARCMVDCKTYLGHCMGCGCCAGSLITCIGDCDTAIVAVMAADDVASVEAARDAYTGG